MQRDRENPFAWYQLGIIYAAEGDMPRARLASAEQQAMNGAMAEALHSAEMAEQALPNRIARLAARAGHRVAGARRA